MIRTVTPAWIMIGGFSSTKGFDLRAATVLAVVTRHTIIGMRVKPHSVLLFDDVQVRPCH
jgi:hypothetical protein